MENCKHSSFDVKPVTVNAGKPTQRSLFVVQCNACGQVVPAIDPMQGVPPTLAAQLGDIRDGINRIGFNLEKIAGKK